MRCNPRGHVLSEVSGGMAESGINAERVAPGRPGRVGDHHHRGQPAVVVGEIVHGAGEPTPGEPVPRLTGLTGQQHQDR